MAENSASGDDLPGTQPASMDLVCHEQDARDRAAVECFEKVHESDGSLVVLFKEGRGMVEVDAQLPESALRLGSGTPSTGDPVPVETVDVVLEALVSQFDMSRKEILAHFD